MSTAEMKGRIAKSVTAFQGQNCRRLLFAHHTETNL